MTAPILVLPSFETCFSSTWLYGSAESLHSAVSGDLDSNGVEPSHHNVQVQLFRTAQQASDRYQITVRKPAASQGQMIAQPGQFCS